LTLVLKKGAPKDTRIEIDGTSLGKASLDTPLPVDPGKRQLAVSAPGYGVRTFEIELANGEEKSLEIAPGRPLPQAAPEADGGDSTSLVPYAYGAFGLAGLGAAGFVATALLAKNKRDTVDENCDAMKQCTSTGVEAAEAGRTMVTLNSVALAVTAVGLGTGITLLVLDSGESEPAVGSTRAPLGPRTALSVAPAMGGASLRFGGSF
jgi:hypothetical protein